ncbi:50S ribosomal protein L3, partial [Francisella tularensis subsp. holarctica]|nr:50S ribosomal protein L3 [Francisella tularensis subsp. holarctica]
MFPDDGVSRPVTGVQVEPHKVTQVKTVETDGYTALLVTTGYKKRSNVNKPRAGHYAQASVEPG